MLLQHMPHAAAVCKLHMLSRALITMQVAFSAQRSWSLAQRQRKPGAHTPGAGLQCRMPLHAANPLSRHHSRNMFGSAAQQRCRAQLEADTAISLCKVAKHSLLGAATSTELLSIKCLHHPSGPSLTCPFNTSSLRHQQMQCWAAQPSIQASAQPLGPQQAPSGHQQASPAP